MPPRPDRPESPADGRSAADGGFGRLAATVTRLRRQVQQADADATGRALVELATGVLVERLHCGPRQAARQLDALAGSAGVTLLELCADIVNQAAGDRLSEVTAPDPADPDRADGPAVGPVGLRAAESGTLVSDDTQAVARSMLQYALAPLGAVAVAVWSVWPDGSLRLSGSAGFPPAEAARWHYVPPAVETLAGRALAQRGTLWARSLADTGLPSIGGRAAPAAGRVVVPSVSGGRLVGALEICWPGPLEPQIPQIRRQVEALAELCAHTLDGTSAAGPVPDAGPVTGPASELIALAQGLWDPAMVLRAQLDARGAVADFRILHLNDRVTDLAGRPRTALAGLPLLEAYPMTAEPGGLFDKLEQVHATGEPLRAHALPMTALVDQLASAAVADVSATRHGEELLLTWRTPDETTRLADLLQHAQRLGRIGGFEEDLQTGRTTWNSQLFDLFELAPTDAPIPLSHLPQYAHRDDATPLGRFLRTLLHHHRPASTAFRLPRPDGTVRHIRVVAEPVLDPGANPVAVRGAYQDVSAQHWTEVALAATRDQLAHTAKQAEEHNRFALQLQHAIMPPATGPIDTAGLTIAVRYRPAEKDHLVGGDWYDIVTLPNRQLLLTIGDIAGHGIQAATAMIVLRNALRGLAATGAGPAAMLGWLNTVALHLTDQVTASAICALYDPDTRVLHWARAGHLPPILVRDGHAAPLEAIKGILLGAVDEARYVQGEVQLEAGDTLLMYTDGLIERRDRSVERSVDQLLTAAQRSTSTIEERLDYLLTHSNADTDDDTCVIGIQLPRAPSAPA